MSVTVRSPGAPRRPRPGRAVRVQVAVVVAYLGVAALVLDGRGAGGWTAFVPPLLIGVLGAGAAVLTHRWSSR
jgi:hypothetical protein